jgi:hypothetical protein
VAVGLGLLSSVLRLKALRSSQMAGGPRLQHLAAPRCRVCPARNVVRGAQHGLGYTLFLGSLIWIATFPVSLSV